MRSHANLGYLGLNAKESNVIDFLISSKTTSVDAIGFSAEGIEQLCQILTGNNTLRTLDLKNQPNIGKNSAKYLKELAESSCLIKISVLNTKMPSHLTSEINTLLAVPIDCRIVPIISTSKSAAKSGFN